MSAKAASSASRAAAAFLLALPAFVLAADLVNINTADLATLETLPGVGSSIAQSIIDNRPYASIEEVSKANGIGEPGSSSYEKIKEYITVGTGSETPVSPPPVASEPAPPQSPTSVAGTIVPSLTVTMQSASGATVGGGSYFSGAAYGLQDAPIENARFQWNFGDGSTAEGQSVFHFYSYPGIYVVTLTASSGYLTGAARLTVTAQPARVALELEEDGSLTVLNRSDKELDIGRWLLSRGEGRFIIPEGTVVIAGGGVRFSPGILKLPDGSATLLYPNGATAVDGSLSPHAAGITYLSGAAAQPVAPAERIAPQQFISGAAGGGTGEAVPTPVMKSQLAAAASSGAQSLTLVSLLGLAALIVLGAAGSLYARLPASPAEAAPKAEMATSAAADEFEIIEVAREKD